MLKPYMVTAVEYWAKGFDTTRSARIQAHLVDEEILWANSSSTEEQRALCVALALHMARARAIKEANEMVPFTTEEKTRHTRLVDFVDMADAEIPKWRKKCKDIEDKTVMGMRFSY